MPRTNYRFKVVATVKGKDIEEERGEFSEIISIQTAAP